MLSTEIVERLQEDFNFKQQNVDTLLTEIIVIDDSKNIYDEGVSKIENDILDGIIHVNEGLELLADAYQDRIDSGCRSDLFWRQVAHATDPGNGSETFTLECTKLDPVEYEPSGLGTDSNIVKFVGSTGVTTFYPINSNFSEESVGFVSFVNNQYFGFELENRYAMKFYSQPYDKDIGNTLVGEFIGTCGLGNTVVTVMQPVGTGMTFGVGQIIVSIGVTAVFSGNAKIVGVGTTVADLRSVPNVGFGSTNSAATVSILTMDSVCGAAVSARDEAQFRVLSDPDEFSSNDRRRYDIPFNQDPFTNETISVAFRESDRSQLGLGISMFISKDGAPNATQSWDQYKKNVPEEVGGIKIEEYAPEPLVGGGKEIYRVGFNQQPIDALGNPAEEGDTRVVDSLTPIQPLYEDTPSCSSAISDALTSAIAEAASRKSSFDNDSGYYNTLTDANKALRDQRNQLQLGLHGIRKMMGTLNDELDVLSDAQDIIGITTVSDILQ